MHHSFTPRRTIALAAVALALSPASALLAQPPASVPGNPATTAAHTGNYKVEPYHTRVQFSVNHMGFTDWYGDFTGTSGSLTLNTAHIDASTVDITIPVANVSTTNAKLDDELRSPAWFDAASFPTIHFTSTRVIRTGARSATIIGNLTFHGVTRPVTLAASFNGAGINPITKGFTVGFNATTTFRRSDFGVKSYLPMIGDTVALRISAAFEQL